MARVRWATPTSKLCSFVFTYTTEDILGIVEGSRYTGESLQYTVDGVRSTVKRLRYTGEKTQYAVKCLLLNDGVQTPRADIFHLGINFRGDCRA